MALAEGLEGRVELLVGGSDLAPALGSGDVPVLGTPRVVALCEEAAVRALDGRLGPGQTSVGTRIELDHLAASRAGARVVASARLALLEGRRLRFQVELREGERVVARGSVWRVVVDRERFLAR